ncbi:hypothetical protein F5Y00DRAFT_257379 [Daldinia vernicosa]|uniref:uncharacterized protein n=1 Tax=Daldinia vernicosa TaxID=114800 RepID=UPI00200779A3|nr:uncharacterized protein F5Y00DRAFT_257379 [Daldinia vernicosa]KAI0853354.1 hypothetical protein F5Y00DRAFT_257379 [Daldinia vernicosa]
MASFPIPSHSKLRLVEVRGAPKPESFHKSALERLPFCVRRMIFEACDSTSKQALAQTCQELRNAGWDFRLQNVKVTGMPPSLHGDLVILKDHMQTQIVRTHTTSIHIAIATFFSRDPYSGPRSNYTISIPGLIRCILSLISKMRRLNDLKITIKSTGPGDELAAWYEDAIHKEVKERLNHTVSYNPLTIRLKGFTSTRAIYFTRMFPRLRHLEVRSNCFRSALDPSITAYLPSLKSLEIYIQLPDISGVVALRNINRAFPLLENLVIRGMSTFTWKRSEVASQLRHFIHLRKLEIATDWYYDPDDEESWEVNETISHLCAKACRSLEYISDQVEGREMHHWKVERDPKRKFTFLRPIF